LEAGVLFPCRGFTGCYAAMVQRKPVRIHTLTPLLLAISSEHSTKSLRLCFRGDLAKSFPFSILAFPCSVSHKRQRRATRHASREGRRVIREGKRRFTQRRETKNRDRFSREKPEWRKKLQRIVLHFVDHGRDYWREWRRKGTLNSMRERLYKEENEKGQSSKLKSCL